MVRLNQLQAGLSTFMKPHLYAGCDPCSSGCWLWCRGWHTILADQELMGQAIGVLMATLRWSWERTCAVSILHI